MSRWLRWLIVCAVAVLAVNTWLAFRPRSCKGKIGCTQGVVATMSAQATKAQRDYHGTPTPTPEPEERQFRSTPTPLPTRTNWWENAA